MVPAAVTPHRVLLVAPLPPPYGGIAGYVASLLAGLKARGFDVVSHDTARYEPLRGRAPGDNRGYLRVLDPRNLVFLLAVVYDWIPYALAIVRRQITIVHVHTASSWAWWRSAVYILLARALGCRTILHAHNAIDIFYDGSGPLQRWLIRRSLGLPHCVVALSDGIRRRIAAMTHTDVVVIPNGVDVRKFRHDKVYGSPCRVLFLGAVGRQKGVADLLEAVSRTGLDGAQLAVTIAGGGDVEGMRRFALELRVGSQVAFTGRISDEEKLELLRTHHVFALPSYAEGQPIAVLEGMAAGMAILTTTVGSIPETVADGEHGFLAAPGDTEALARHLVQLCEPAMAQAMGERCREVARERYDFGRVVQDVIDVYAQASGPRAADRVVVTP